MDKPTLTKEIVLDFASRNTKFKASDLVVFLRNKVSRQYVSKFLNYLVVRGELVKEGSARSTFYALPTNINALGIGMNKRFENVGLKEHEVLEEIRNNFPALYSVSENIRSIFDYSFSEMLNNAIDHSESKFITVEVNKSADVLSFEIRDTGIGVFNSIMKKRGLSSPLEAVQDLLKGKTTTQPEAHSGQGIFFTSRAADLFILEGGNTRLRIDNNIQDTFIEEIKPSVVGTNVRFKISTTSKRHMRDIFDKFTSDLDNPDFDKTEVLVRLYITGTIYVSRSQARRILLGLDQFKSIVLDFDRVPTIGQAFADEVFRVFKKAHPDIKITAINANEAVQFMIDRA